MADNQQEKISQFKSLAGVDEGRAKFYLESAGWNLELAVASFFEHGDSEDDDGSPMNIPIQQEGPPSRNIPTESNVPSKPQPARATGPPSRFGTISNLQQGDNDSSDSDEGGQAFYAGGSEHSGQQVLGPPKKKKDSKKIIDNMFKSAKEHGAEEVSESARNEKPSGSKFAFRGAGYKLGDTEDAPINLIRGAPLQDQRRQVDMVLKLWKNGFSVDDGPLRDFSDPANKEFLDSVSKGEVPKELTTMGREVNLDMEDHRTEEYVKPKVTVQAFTGAGHMLGSPAPNIAKVNTASASSGSSNESTAKQTVSVNESKPTTNVQIRLADGSRLTAKLNHSHRVSDIRRYITIARPEYTSTNFVLLTTFPNKELTDETQTLEEAKLLNAVIVQRMK